MNHPNTVRKLSNVFHPLRAAHIAAGKLFKNGSGKIADRLVLVTNDGHDLGGWCFTAVREEIEAAIREAIKEVEKT